MKCPPDGCGTYQNRPPRSIRVVRALAWQRIITLPSGCMPPAVPRICHSPANSSSVKAVTLAGQTLAACRAYDVGHMFNPSMFRSPGAAASRQAEAVVTKPRLVIADDTPRVLGQSAATRNGRFEVVARAMNGAEAVSEAIRHSPDLIVLD